MNTFYIHKLKQQTMGKEKQITEKAARLAKYHKGYMLAQMLGISKKTLNSRFKDHNWRINEAATIESEHRAVTNIFKAGDTNLESF